MTLDKPYKAGCGCDWCKRQESNEIERRRIGAAAMQRNDRWLVIALLTFTAICWALIGFAAWSAYRWISIFHEMFSN